MTLSLSMPNNCKETLSYVSVVSLSKGTSRQVEKEERDNMLL